MLARAKVFRRTEQDCTLYLISLFFMCPLLVILPRLNCTLLETRQLRRTPYLEAEFLDVIGTKEEFSPFLFTVTSTNRFYSSPPLSKSGLKLVCNVSIVYGNLKSENSQDYAQKHQLNCTNSASV
jgi:hypothetical protein